MPFPQFNQLNDELSAYVLSFASSAPFEVAELRPSGTLTHEFPLLSKRIRNIVRSSTTLWKEALIRLCIKETDIWKSAVMSIVLSRSAAAASTGPFIMQQTDESEKSPLDELNATKELVEKACNVVRDAPANEYQFEGALTIPERVFRYIVSCHLRFSAPAFSMPGEAIRGQEIILHFFEPRYRLLIREVMEGYTTDQEGNLSVVGGNEELRPYPSFVYACHGTLAPRSPACIVELRRCIILPDGRADVMLVPCAHVYIETVNERPNSGGLFDVRSIRMGKMATEVVETGMQRHRRNWINNQTGMGEENYWVEGGTVNGRRVRGSIHAIMAFLDARPGGGGEAAHLHGGNFGGPPQGGNFGNFGDQPEGGNFGP
eukprot:CAMPEP_0116021050 /NCGR_PEP_ID=MMETSP0321-20121206/10157_1 /TAXON_ID=163516 /ORGANISM="Leptocylindrus danicus var. danicus, Strain B650" /LENGTH=373 /DNA_ID=CAMNT_0003491849 /DNA_START=78 /DNA_END=1199 /DNA_ORIENTATION=-